MNTDRMHAIAIEQSGPEGRLRLSVAPMPKPEPGEVRIRVAYAGVNRADLLQRLGQYPAPADASPLPGLEVSGTIEALGAEVDATQWRLGMPVCALVNGGGYAEFVCAPAGQVLPVPEGWSLEDAAALPEAILTVWLALIETAQAKAGDWVLIQGGRSGIGSVGIPMLALLGLRVIATARTQEKCDFCWSQGAEAAFPTDRPDLVEIIRQTSEGNLRAALDMLGGAHLATALRSLGQGGHLVNIAFLNGTKEPVPLGALLSKNLHWHGTTLRSQSPAKKAAMVAALRAQLWPKRAASGWRPTIDSIHPLPEAEKAQARMEERLHLGKILLKVGTNP